MHDAPSVSYPVGRCRLPGALLALAWLLGGAVLASWVLATALGPRQWAAIGVWCAAGALAAHAWWHSPAGELAWAGGQWRFGGEPAGAPRAALDLQAVLLLQVLAPRGTLWLWAERARAPGDWDALRRAVYSRARDDAPQRAAPPVASP